MSKPKNKQKNKQMNESKTEKRGLMMNKTAVRTALNQIERDDEGDAQRSDWREEQDQRRGDDAMKGLQRRIKCQCTGWIGNVLGKTIEGAGRDDKQNGHEEANNNKTEGIQED
jgi:hypothetical protein